MIVADIYAAGRAQLEALFADAPDDPHPGDPWRRPWLEPGHDRKAFVAHVATTMGTIEPGDETTRMWGMVGYSVAAYKRFLARHCAHSCEGCP